MPELPEVEIARRTLARWGADRRVVRVEVLDPAVIRARLSTRPSALLPGGPELLERLLVGGRLARPARIGKRLGLTTGPPDGVLVHLGMTGRWALGADPPRHARLGLVLEGGEFAWFVDPRRFGCLVPTDDLDSALSEGLGPDALEVDGALLTSRLRGRRAVKIALMDQRVLAGLGNIHAAEALWRAGLDPWTPCEDVTAHHALSEGIAQQLSETLIRDDSPDLAYLSDAGSANPFAVYGHAGEPCPRCATPIRRERLGGRATYWCPSCQPGPAP